MELLHVSLLRWSLFQEIFVHAQCQQAQQAALHLMKLLALINALRLDAVLHTLLWKALLQEEGSVYKEINSYATMCVLKS